MGCRRAMPRIYDMLPCFCVCAGFLMFMDAVLVLQPQAGSRCWHAAGVTPFVARDFASNISGAVRAAFYLQGSQRNADLDSVWFCFTLENKAFGLF